MKDFSRVYTKAFNAERRVLGPEGDLGVVTHSTTAGYETAQTVITGWKAKRTSKDAAGEEFMRVDIADQSGLATLFKGSPSHLLIGGLYYKVKGIEKPFTATDSWLIRCAPTGEKKPA